MMIIGGAAPENGLLADRRGPHSATHPCNGTGLIADRGDLPGAGTSSRKSLPFSPPERAGVPSPRTICDPGLDVSARPARRHDKLASPQRAACEHHGSLYGATHAATLAVGMLVTGVAYGDAGCEPKQSRPHAELNDAEATATAHPNLQDLGADARYRGRSSERSLPTDLGVCPAVAPSAQPGALCDALPSAARLMQS
jgi:hypothetical protein